MLLLIMRERERGGGEGVGDGAGIMNYRGPVDLPILLLYLFNH